MVKPLDIAICGAGMAGLTAAQFLMRSGHRIQVFDQFPAPRPVGSGLVLQPVGLAVLDHLGLGDRVRTEAAPLSRMEGYEATGQRRVLNVGYARSGAEIATGYGIHRATLFDILLEGAKGAGVPLQTGCKVDRLEGRFIHFENGQREGPFDLILDSTGAGSVLSPLHGKPMPFGAIWSTLPWPEGTDLPYDRLSQAYQRASKMVGILPVGQLPDQAGKHAALFWSLPRAELNTWHENGLEAWKAEVLKLWPALDPFLHHIQSTDQLIPAHYSHGTMRTPVQDHVVFLGDAAHRTSPQLGQGANMAILDAYALSQALASIHHLDDALRRFVLARRSHIWAYQLMSRFFTPLYQSSRQDLPWIRDRVLYPLSQAPVMRQVLTRLVRGELLPPIAGLPAGRMKKTQI